MTGLAKPASGSTERKNGPCLCNNRVNHVRGAHGRPSPLEAPLAARFRRVGTCEQFLPVSSPRCPWTPAALPRSGESRRPPLDGHVRSAEPPTDPYRSTRLPRSVRENRRGSPATAGIPPRCDPPWPIRPFRGTFRLSSRSSAASNDLFRPDQPGNGLGFALSSCPASSFQPSIPHPDSVEVRPMAGEPMKHGGGDHPRRQPVNAALAIRGPGSGVGTTMELRGRFTTTGSACHHVPTRDTAAIRFGPASLPGRLFRPRSRKGDRTH